MDKIYDEIYKQINTIKKIKSIQNIKKTSLYKKLMLEHNNENKCLALCITSTLYLYCY